MKIKGIVAAPGLAVGPVFELSAPPVHVLHETVAAAAVDDERARAREAMARYYETLRLCEPMTEIERALLNATMELLNDPYLEDAIVSRIRDLHYCAEWAIEAAIEAMAREIQALDDPYLSARSVDFEDLAHGILMHLNGADQSSFELSEPSIIVAEMLNTSSLVMIDTSQVLGFISEKGGISSHAAILAQTLGIPYLIGVPYPHEFIHTGECIVLDADAGEVDVQPTVEEIAAARRNIATKRAKEAQWDAQRDEQALSLDGRRIAVEANIGGLDDLEFAKERGAEGVGLFRTEFFFMAQEDYPDEETQFALYRAAVQEMGGPLVVRTLDVGADKALPYDPLEAEENPALGRRGIRFSLDVTGPFRSQLRALLRAAALGDVKILLPMVSALEELERVQQMIAAEKDALRSAGTAVGDVEVGVMIETPAAVFLADALAEHCDFFSIGTNDLTQYIIAADRTNAKVQHLFHSFHPAVLRAIDAVIQSAHHCGIPCAMCGALAADPLATRLLIGMGLDVFSVPGAQIPRIKDVIRQCDVREEQAFAREVLAKSRLDEGLDLIREHEGRWT